LLLLPLNFVVSAIAKIRFFVNAGDLVFGTKIGDYYSISPIDNEDVMISGIPAHSPTERHQEKAEILCLKQ